MSNQNFTNVLCARSNLVSVFSSQHFIVISIAVTPPVDFSASISCISSEDRLKWECNTGWHVKQVGTYKLNTGIVRYIDSLWNWLLLLELQQTTSRGGYPNRKYNICPHG